MENSKASSPTTLWIISCFSTGVLLQIGQYVQARRRGLATQPPRVVYRSITDRLSEISFLRSLLEVVSHSSPSLLKRMEDMAFAPFDRYSSGLQAQQIPSCLTSNNICGQNGLARMYSPNNSPQAKRWIELTIATLNEELKEHLPRLESKGDWSEVACEYVAFLNTLMICSSDTSADVMTIRPHRCRQGPASVEQALMFKLLNEQLITRLKALHSAQSWARTMLWYFDSATAIRINRPPFRFTDLPTELRHHIYSMIITPEMAQAHVSQYRIPSMFQVSRAIKKDFVAYYYSRRVFRVEMFNYKAPGRHDITGASLIQAILQGTKRYEVQAISKNAATCKTWVESRFIIDESMSIGILRIVGEAEKAYLCAVWSMPGEADGDMLEQRDVKGLVNARIIG